MNTLEKICAKKAQHVKAQEARRPMRMLETQIKRRPDPEPFIEAIENHEGTAIIAEIKKASPSKGVIRKDFEPPAIAGIYEEAGACCLSVLTDEPYFKGSDKDLQQVKAESDLPVLRKDFMIDPYQIYESRALGADCILLIMAALTDERARELYNLSHELGMDVLVEIHNEQELKRALELKPRMIGVNSRDLETMEVDMQTALDLADKIPDKIVKIAESGIRTPTHIRNLRQAGYDGFLVGESLMSAPDIGMALTSLLQNT